MFLFIFLYSNLAPSFLYVFSLSPPLAILNKKCPIENQTWPPVKINLRLKNKYTVCYEIILLKWKKITKM